MVDDGIILIKYFLNVSRDEQTRRLESRIDDPRKIWKLSPTDLKSYGRRYAYLRARDTMIVQTGSGWAPWHVVDNDDKKRGRLNIITHLLSQIPYEPPGAHGREDAQAAEPQRVRRTGVVAAQHTDALLRHRGEDPTMTERVDTSRRGRHRHEVVRAGTAGGAGTARRRSRAGAVRGQSPGVVAAERTQRAPGRADDAGLAAVPVPVPELHADHPRGGGRRLDGDRRALDGSRRPRDHGRERAGGDAPAGQGGERDERVAVDAQSIGSGPS